jgi:hypothetical protein
MDVQEPGAFRHFPAFQSKQMSTHFLRARERKLDA